MKTIIEINVSEKLQNVTRLKLANLLMKKGSELWENEQYEKLKVCDSCRAAIGAAKFKDQFVPEIKKLLRAGILTEQEINALNIS